MSSEEPNSLCAFTRTELRRLDLARVIWERSAEDRDDVGFSTRMFLIANLPHSDPGTECKVWSRTNGDAILTIQQGFVSENGQVVPVGYPYGAVARLLVLFLVTEVVKTRCPKVVFGRSLSEFLRALHLPIEGRRIDAVKKQLTRLLNANIRFSFKNERVAIGRNGSLADTFVLWSTKATNADGTAPLSFTLLNEGVFLEILRHPVPLDMGAIRGLRDSPLALDLFCWLSYRLYTLRHPLSLTWCTLSTHFGSDYAEPKEFARHCRLEFRRVHTVWPTLNCKFIRGGITLYPAKQLPVQRREP